MKILMKLLFIIAFIGIYFLLKPYFFNSTTEILIENEIIDLGEIKSDTSVTGKFKLNNIGENDFNINSISTDCNCTVAKLKRKHIKPGETVELVAVYQNELKGYFHQIIYVDGNNKRGLIQLQFRGITF